MTQTSPTPAPQIERDSPSLDDNSERDTREAERAGQSSRSEMMSETFEELLSTFKSLTEELKAILSYFTDDLGSIMSSIIDGENPFENFSENIEAVRTLSIDRQNISTVPDMFIAGVITTTETEGINSKNIAQWFKAHNRTFLFFINSDISDINIEGVQTYSLNLPENNENSTISEFWENTSTQEYFRNLYRAYKNNPNKSAIIPNQSTHESAAMACILYKIDNPDKTTEEIFTAVTPSLQGNSDFTEKYAPLLEGLGEETIAQLKTTG